MDAKEERARRYHAAARELEAKGERATLRAVRQAVGGGSMTDVAAAMQLYRERAIPSTERSDGVPEPMLAAVSDLYRRAQDEATSLVAAERAALAAAQQDVQAFRLEIQDVAVDVERERDAALAGAESAKAEVEAVTAQLNKARGRMEHLEELLRRRWPSSARRGTNGVSKPSARASTGRKA